MLSTIHKDIDASTLSTETKRGLKSVAKRITESAEFPKDIVKAIEDVSEKASTRLTLYNRCLSLYRLSPTFAKHVGKYQHTELLLNQDELHEEQREARSSAAGSSRDNDISWETIASKKYDDAFEKIGGRSLLMYRLLVNPGIGFMMRLDGNDLRIARKPSDVDNDKDNWYVMGTKSKPPRIILNSYKTHGKFGQIDQEVSRELDKYIPIDQKYVFEGFPGEPMAANTFGRIIEKGFKAVDPDKKITINVLRRAYSTHLENDKSLSERDKRRKAHLTGHRMSTHKQYVHSKGGSSDSE